MAAVRALGPEQPDETWVTGLQASARCTSEEAQRWTSIGRTPMPGYRYRDDMLREIHTKATERFGKAAIRIVSGPGHSPL
jgi:hypothetical protein